jgi:hypothetical protein
MNDSNVKNKGDLQDEHRSPEVASSISRVRE